MTQTTDTTLDLTVEVAGEPQRVPLAGDELWIGRGAENGLVLPDPSVSRRHAVLRCQADGVWQISDEGSTNGVYVNRQQVKSAPVVAGDVLHVGGFEIQVLSRRGEAGAATGVPATGVPATGVPATGVPATGVPATGVPATGVPVPGKTVPVGVEPPAVPGGAVQPTLATVVRPLAEMAPGDGLSAEAAGRRQVDASRAGFFARLAGQLLTAASIDEVLERVLDVVFDALSVERGFILLLDESGELPRDEDRRPLCQLVRIGEHKQLRPTGEVPVSATMLAQVLKDKVALITLDAQVDQRLKSGDSIRLHSIRSAMCAPLWAGDSIVGVLQVDSPQKSGSFSEGDLDFVTAVANYGAVAVERLRFAERVERQERLRARLERYHSPAVIEEVLEGEEAAEGQLRRLRPVEATVLFADLAGFTAFAEDADPGEVAELLAGFFNVAVESIFAAGGTLDKFIGDCVMAFFGAPMSQDDHARRAVAAAVEIQRALARHQQERGEGAEGPILEARIGINSGPVVVGEVGSRRRVDYTVLGNAVNVASRLEQFAATPGEIVLGAETERLLGGTVPTEPLGELSLKGLSQKVAAFRVARHW